MYNIVLETNEATVVTEHTPIRKRRADYQSEAKLKNIFNQDLVEQFYEYLKIKTEDDLVENLKVQLEKLNHITFSETEWLRFYGQYLANDTEGIVEKTFSI